MAIDAMSSLGLDDHTYRMQIREFMRPTVPPKCVSCGCTLTQDELNWHENIPGDGPSVRECFVCLDEGAHLAAWEARHEPEPIGAVSLF